MVLLAVIGRVVVVVSVMIALAAAWVVGTDRLVAGVLGVRGRLRETRRYFAVLLVVLVLNKVARDSGPELSWLFKLHVTSTIYAVEGASVARIQSVATSELTAVFGFVYVYGYTFLLVFPFVAYVLVDEVWPIERTILTFVTNYGVGVVCYTAFISYGPFNLMPDLVTPLLYTEYPLSRLLTAEVNANTNVFPSLHTSLSVAVAGLSWQTREMYPRWPLIAAPLMAAVVFSTLYLGIHWVIDVIAGTVLGVASVLIGTRLAEM